jgi:hypothetical protein
MDWGSRDPKWLLPIKTESHITVQVVGCRLQLLKGVPDGAIDV